ncbi:MAG: hypothetical protein KDD89_03380 [Anaerolineales bacterium]|nr:hypothetical protein [Anaerolineales bacterium]
MRPEKVPYLYMQNGQMNVIPDVPALVCDCCQHTIHDAAFMKTLNQIAPTTSSPTADMEPDSDAPAAQEWHQLLNSPFD